MKSCTPLCGRARSRYVICTGFLPVFAALAFAVLLAFPQFASAQSPFFTQALPAANPLNGLDVNNRSVPVFVNFGGDSDLDLITGRQNTTAVAGQPGRNSMFVYSVRSGAPGTPVFTEEADADNPFFGFTTGLNTAPCAGDFDGDGDTDFIVGLNNGRFHYYRNDGDDMTPDFSASFFNDTHVDNPLQGVDIGTNANPTAADFDGDGDVDIIAGISTGVFYYFENSQVDDAISEPLFTVYNNSHLSNPMNGRSVASAAAPCAVDLDCDGDLDIVSGEALGTFTFFRNDGDATTPVYGAGNVVPYFTAGVPIIDAGNNSTPAFADFDNDGDLDLLSGNSVGKFVLFRNNACAPNLSCVGVPPSVDLDPEGSFVFADEVALGVTHSSGCGNTTTLLSPEFPYTLDCDLIGTNDIQIIVLDQYNGRKDTCSVTIMVQDITDPTPICHTEYTVLLDENGEASITDASVLDNGSTDNCNNDLVDPGNPAGLTFEIDPADVALRDADMDGFIDFDCADIALSPITISLMVTDASANSSNCMVMITVEDTTAPEPELVELDPVSIPGCDGIGAGIGFDEDDALDELEAYLGGLLPSLIPTAEDIVCAGTLNGTITDSEPDFLGGAPGVYEITWTYNDGTNTSTQTQMVTVENDAPVFMNCPGDITIIEDDNIGFPCSEPHIWVAPTADDCQDGMMITGIQSSHAPGANFNVGNTLVTYIATDSDGNSGYCYFTVTVEDNTPPVLNNTNGGPSYGPFTNCGRIVTWTGSVTASDPCSSPSSRTVVRTTIPAGRNTTSGSFFPSGTTTIVYTATDASGNSTSTELVITVVDPTSPTFTSCPTSTTVNTSTSNPCTANVLLTTPTATDATLCNGPLTYTLSVDGGPANPVSGNTSVTGLGTGVHTFSYVATDGVNMSVPCAFTITVQDVVPPSLTCPTDPPTVTVTPSMDVTTCSANVSWTAPTPTDNCGIALVDGLEVSYNEGDSYIDATGTIMTTVTENFIEGNHVVYYQATDINGLSSFCSFTVRVRNNRPPVITFCQGNTVISADEGVCTAEISYFSSFDDNCGQGTLTYHLTNVSTAPIDSDNDDLDTYDFPVGITTVYVKATDVSGMTNTLACSFTVTVTDNEQPHIDEASACPANMVVGNDEGECSAVVSWAPPVFADNCSMVGSPVLAPSNLPPGSTFAVGTTTFITYTQYDASSNLGICSFSITVEDQEGPTMDCPDDIVVSTDPSLCTASLSGYDVLSEDNCPGVVNDYAIPNENSELWDLGDAFPIGTTSVYYEAIDLAGNTTTCNFSVTVEDTEGPTIMDCPNDIVYYIVGNNCSFPVSWTEPINMTDNCGSIVSFEGPVSDPAGKVSGSMFQTGVTTITYTATDDSGVEGYCTFTVTINDSTNPTITCPSDVQVIVDVETCTATFSELGNPIVGDNCTAVGDIEVENDAPSEYSSYTIVTWTATDASGLTATCTQEVYVLEGTPVVDCPSDITINISNTSCVISDADFFAITGYPYWDYDGCASDGNSFDDAPPVFEAGSHTVIWTIDFFNGETVTCEQNVLVVDQTNPSITCPPNVSMAANGPNCTATGVALGSPTATDNCQGFSVTNNAPNPFPLGTTTVTHTITDAGGRTATCEQMVTITGGGTPSLTCPANMTVNATSGCSATVTNLGTPTTNGLGCTGLTQPNPATRNPSGTTFTGVTTVTWTATFSNASTATCVQTISVLDQTNPTIVCPSNVAVNANNQDCSASNVVLGAPNAQDNCPGVLATNNGLVTYPLGVTTVTHTATDAGGRTATCNQTVTVNGNGTPTITCPGNVTVNAQTGCTATVSNLGTPSTVNNPCGNATQTGLTRLPSGNSFTGITTVTWTATYNNGGTATCQHVVSVNDATPPSITCPQDITVLNDLGDCFAHNVNLGTPISSDNCGSPIVTNNAPSAQDGYEIGNNTVVWTATDGSSNGSDCEQNVFVEAREEVCNGLDDDCDGSVDEDVAGGLAELAKALAGDGASGDSYGVSVGISGNYAVVGAHMDDDKGTSSGAAYILFYNGTTWVQQKKIVPTDGAAGDLFGENVAIDGDLVIIGAREDDDRGTNSGSAYIYGRNVGGTNNWGLVKKLIASVDGAAYDRFGLSVDIHNGYAAVGAPQDDDGSVGNKGSVYIFGQNTGGLGNWGQLQKRLATDGTFFDEFGSSVSLGSTGGRTYLIAGAPKDDEAGTNSNSGAAFVFRDNMGGADGWGQIKKLVPTDAAIDDNFGFSVAISGEHALVGANLEDNSGLSNNGSAYVFAQALGGADNWGQRTKLIASDAQDGDNFGWSVALDGTEALVGARNDDDPGVDGGSAYFFSQNEGSPDFWGEVGKVLASDGASNDNFGTSVGISGGNSVIGAFRDDITVQSDRGSAYFFANGCGSNFSGNNVDRTGEQATILSGASSVRLFPNPTSDLLNIDVVLETESDVTITVTDAAGRIVSQVFSGVSAPEARYQWDASTVPAGLYFVRVDGGSLRKVVPVSVVK